jgi:hypothetical protein
MGSVNGRVGNTGSIVGFTFTAAGQDSGVVGVNPAASAQYPPIRLWPVGWEKFTFQVTGTGTNYAITVYGTFDANTANGVAGAAEWYELPGTPTDSTIAQWQNPMLSNVPGANAFQCKAPLLAVRATSAATPGNTVTGTVNFQYQVVS